MDKITDDNQEILRALYRTDFNAFYQKSVEILFPGREYHPAPYIPAITYRLEQILDGIYKRRCSPDWRTR